MRSAWCLTGEQQEENSGELLAEFPEHSKAGKTKAQDGDRHWRGDGWPGVSHPGAELAPEGAEEAGGSRGRFCSCVVKLL